MGTMPKFKKRFEEERISLDKRSSSRMDLRPSDSIFLCNVNNEKCRVQVFDYSIGGFSIIIEADQQDRFFTDQVNQVDFEMPDLSVFSVTASLSWISKYRENKVKVGFKFLPSAVSRVVQPKYSLDLSRSFPITGSVYKPYLFYERVVVRILTITDKYFKLEFADSEVLIFPGIKFEFFVSSPSANFKPILFEALESEVSKDKRLTIKAKVLDLPKLVNAWLGQYLVFHIEASPKDVRDLGFNVKHLSNGFRFRFVKTEDEYQEVLKLRFHAYKEAGKVAEGKTHVDMVAKLDSYSRIMAVYHGLKLIGSVAIAFPPNEHVILDTEQGFPGGYPKKIPPKIELVEFSRLCTDPAYRKTDLLVRMFEYTYKAVHCGNRGYFLSSTDDKLWPLYKKLGFKKTGMSYAHPYLAGLRHHVIIGKKTTPDSAFGIDPLSWNYLWRDMGSFLASRRLVKRKFFVKVYIWLISSIGKILKINLKHRS
jgi:hypothetical protein